MLSDQLIPIDKIAKQAGTDKIHLAYLTKLRLIPQTVRRKVGDKISGCYPAFVVSQIKRIEELKTRGLTYSQIRFEMDNKSLVTNNEPIIENFSRQSNNFSQQNFNPMVYLVIGLILGYVLFSLNSINNNLSNKDNKVVTMANTLPSETDVQKVMKVSVAGESDPASSQVYLIAVPNKNL
ncbi:hypothetical protein HY310_00010, partial [Candidatus Microgenomates bacterium]|nr:hypothetical protein [Candidatus Microgenomates bacterium]